ncbi:dTDP-4-dehydrorhamnose reductase [Rhodospirillales bacterium]|nr:dTDP-4-dehydrorhamnose reductase [Rhodospirillales bacterium]
MTLRIIVTGKTGQVGRALYARLQGGHEVIALGRDDLNLETWGKTSSLFDEFSPDLIINAAAYTDVEKAEDEETLAHLINTELPHRLSELAQRCNAGFIHFSTDYVFDGTKTKPYLETDTPNPINAYGRSKLGAEQQIAATCDAWIVARLSWVYAETGNNFLNTMLSLFTKQQILKVVADQSGAPTPAFVIADVIARIIDQVPSKDFYDFLTNNRGLLHIACRGHTSWWEFTKMIASLSEAGGLKVVTKQIVPIPTANYWGQAQRPMNSRLDIGRLKNTFGIKPPCWTNALESVIKRRLALK